MGVYGKLKYCREEALSNSGLPRKLQVAEKKAAYSETELEKNIFDQVAETCKEGFIDSLAATYLQCAMGVVGGACVVCGNEVIWGIVLIAFWGAMLVIVVGL